MATEAALQKAFVIGMIEMIFRVPLVLHAVIYAEAKKDPDLAKLMDEGKIIENKPLKLHPRGI